MLKSKIASLISLIEGTEINEIEVSSFWGAQKVRLSKGKKTTKENNDLTDSSPKLDNIDIKDSTIDDKPVEDNVSESEKEVIEDTNKIDQKVNVDKLYNINAPLVGTYYSSTNPDEEPFVKVGDKVSSGQVLCIIEAMKIFNEIESDTDGIIKEILVENGSPVEFDQLLFSIVSE